jgi:membrane associated rhomboid family serine protease
VRAAATFTHCLANPDDFTPLVGASGAVSGVLAAHTILLPWTKIRIPSSLLGPNSLPAWVFAAQWVGFQVL